MNQLGIEPQSPILMASTLPVGKLSCDNY